MKDITKIIVPFDTSTTTERALDYAISFAGDDKSIEILLTHISDMSEGISIHNVLDERIAQIKKDNPSFRGTLNSVIKSGELVENILETQKEFKADLVIMGTKGAEDESATTNTSRLTLEADFPVIAIPETIKEFGVKKIALILGQKEIEDATVLGTLLDVARRFHAQVHVLTICNEDGCYGYTPADERNENAIEYYLENFYSHHTFQENTDIEKGIFEYIKDKEIDLLAILPRNHAKKNGPSEGRLTKLLTLHTDIPLLTID
ncbi:universal stress protein [Aquimarina sp. M1]